MTFRASAAVAALAVALLLPSAGAQGLRPSVPFSGARPLDNTPRAADYIVAVVNSEPITNNEVRMRMARFEQQLTQQGQAIPPRGEFARQVLDRLISEKAQLQLAKENGIKVEDALVDQAELNIARQNGISVEELRRRISADGLNPTQFRDELRDQLILTRLREREVDSRVKVTDLEVDQYIREQQAQANNPAAQQLNLAHILLPVPENASEAQIANLRARAVRITERARAGEDFAKLARETTDGQETGATGLPVGLRSPDRLPPLFVQAVQNLPEGGVSDPVRSAAGFHVIKLVERKKGGLPTTVVQNHARHILLRPSPQQSEAQAVQRLAEMKRRLQSGQADFAQLAREYSQDASSRNGGDLGWSSPGLFVPEFEEVLNALAPGQISDPLISRFGVHLIQLLERREAPLGQKELREYVRAMLREKKLDEAYATWAQEVRGRAYVELREPPR